MLERVIREAERQSKQLANDINNWMNEESLRTELSRSRGRRSAVGDPENPGSSADDFIKIRKRRDIPESEDHEHKPHTVSKKGVTSQTGQAGGKKGNSNPVLQAFDLMKLLISEREKSRKNAKLNKVNGRKATGSQVKVDRKYVKKGKSSKPHTKENDLLRSGAKEKSKSKVSHRSNLGKVAASSKESDTRNLVQMLKAMPRKKLRDILKEKGLGKYWNVVKVPKKDPTKRKLRRRGSKSTSGKRMKITHNLTKAKKHSGKKSRIHKKTLKASLKQVPKSKKTKGPSTHRYKKRTKIQRPVSKPRNFQEKRTKTKAMLKKYHLAALKKKIHRTNELKLRVAKALLAHCATQNKLRDIFRDVNISLKKAAVLVEIIARRLGMETSDVQKMIKQHPEKAVQQFLSEVF